MLSERRGGTNIIKRTEEFLKDRNNKLEILKKELERKNFSQCSFKPHLSTAAR
jgi:predicted DNA-binding protein YlxM (UPF0122 family)